MEARIFTPVKDALQAMVTGFLEGSKKDGEIINKAVHQPFLGELVTSFCPIDSFETKLEKMDGVFERYPTFASLQEFCFDLLMINFFTADAKQLDEGYLESAEWMAIEDNTLDRGTEFLNIFLYVNECKETGTDVSLDDFLKEFLLTEDDLYQDEYIIYEPIIKNEHLVDGTVQDIVEVAAKIDDESMQEIFVPLMVFFNQRESYAERLQQLLDLSVNKPADTALFMALTAFESSLDAMEG